MEEIEFSGSSDDEETVTPVTIASTTVRNRIEEWISRSLHERQPGGPVGAMGQGGQGDSGARSTSSSKSTATVVLRGPAGDAAAVMLSHTTVIPEVHSLIQKRQGHGHGGSYGSKECKVNPGIVMLNVEIQKLIQFKEQMENLLKTNIEKLSSAAVKMLEQLQEGVLTHKDSIESAKSLLTRSASDLEQERARVPMTEAERRFKQWRAREEGVAQARLKAIEVTVEARVKAAESAEAKALAAKAALDARRQTVEALYKWIQELKSGSDGSLNQWKLSKELVDQQKKLDQECKRNEERSKMLKEREIALGLQVANMNLDAEALKQQAFDLKLREDDLLVAEQSLSELQKEAGKVADSLESLFTGHQFHSPTKRISETQGLKEQPQLRRSFSDILKAVRSKNGSGVKEALKGLKKVSVADLNKFEYIRKSSLLHLAAENNALDMVWALLEHGCDPSLKDSHGIPAYNCTNTKECRTVFRKFRARFPNKYDYFQAQLPAPLPKFLTAEEEENIAEMKRTRNRVVNRKTGTRRQPLVGPTVKRKACSECKRFVVFPLAYEGKAFCSSSCLKDHWKKSGRN